ncbi:MAG: hypothetical protein IKM79_07620 [Bacteroidales bacterium]|nr:hypothetical protein [Bacteroidales bacterium]
MSRCLFYYFDGELVTETYYGQYLSWYIWSYYQQLTITANFEPYVAPQYTITVGVRSSEFGVRNSAGETPAVHSPTTARWAQIKVIGYRLWVIEGSSLHASANSSLFILHLMVAPANS